jgi:hypothetical protein
MKSRLAVLEFRGAPKGAAAGLQSPQTLQNRDLKNTDFVDTVL